jgi:succinate dehydrogenase (ubiquinone) cytochrome b560 subunit
MIASLARRTARRATPIARTNVRSFTTTNKSSFNEELPGARNGVAYTELPSNKKRPVSPHVTIYAFPVIALSSITNRVTGAMLCAGVYGIGTMSLVGIDTTGLMMTLGNSALGPALKFGVAFPVVYHYICGVRHVIWDKYVMGFNNDAMNQSSLLVAGASVAISGVAAIL